MTDTVVLAVAMTVLSLISVIFLPEPGRIGQIVPAPDRPANEFLDGGQTAVWSPEAAPVD